MNLDLFAGDDWRTTLRCPACGYRPEDEVGPDTDAPATEDEALDFFDVLGADEGCLFCPKCGQEFNAATGEKREYTEDKPWPT